MKLYDIATYVSDRINSEDISLEEYVTTDSLLQNKMGRECTQNLPPVPTSLTSFQPGDVLVANIRPYLKKVWMADTFGGCSADVLAFRAKKGYSSNFLYATISQDVFFKYVMKGVKGTRMPRGVKSHIMQFPIYLSDTEQMGYIGAVLANIDRKIELNKAINANLEAMAKQLYDYWFVQFDFPDANGRPYKSSGGKMLYNPKLKRPIPASWEDCTLNYYIGRITNGLNPRKNFILGHGNNFYVTIRSLVGTDIDWNNCDKCDDEALEKINKRSQLQIGDVIFSAIGTIGRTYFIQEKPVDWNISETSFTLRANPVIPTALFYAILRSDEIQLQADKKAMGSTLRCLVMDSLLKIPYIKIPKSIGENFAQVFSPIIQKQYTLNKEMRDLTALRDSLLPMLMNGQVSVN